MRINSLVINRKILAILVPILLLGVLCLMMQSIELSGDRGLSYAITADLLLTVPLIYLLLIRNTTIPKTTVVLILVAGLVIGINGLP